MSLSGVLLFPRHIRRAVVKVSYLFPSIKEDKLIFWGYLSFFIMRDCTGIYERVWAIFRVCLLPWESKRKCRHIRRTMLKRISWYFESIWVFLLWEIVLVYMKVWAIFGVCLLPWESKGKCRHFRRTIGHLFFVIKIASRYFGEYFRVFDMRGYEPFLGYVYFLGRVRGSAAVFGGQWKRHYDSFPIAGWK